jgi:hypothetical protein
MNGYDDIRKAAEVLLEAGVRLIGLDYEAGGFNDISNPEEAVEYVAELHREEAE